MGNANVPAGVALVHSDEVENTYRKVALRIVPLTVVAYIIAYIDRVNVGFAKLQFMQTWDSARPFMVWVPDCSLLDICFLKSRVIFIWKRSGRA